MQAKFLCDNAGVVSIGVTDAIVDQNNGMGRLLCKHWMESGYSRTLELLRKSGLGDVDLDSKPEYPLVHIDSFSTEYSIPKLYPCRCSAAALPETT